jgi:hypothetical protein
MSSKSVRFMLLGCANELVAVVLAFSSSGLQAAVFLIGVAGLVLALVGFAMRDQP